MKHAQQSDGVPRLAWVLSVVFLFLISFTQEAYSQNRKFLVAYGGVSGTTAPLWLTKEERLFEKQGLQVDLLYITSTKAAQAMVAGDLSFATSTGSLVINSNMAGSGMVIIAGMTNTIPFSLVTTASISRPEDLKGKKIAISQLGGSSDFAARFALTRMGLQADKEVAIVQIGSQPERLAALTAGGVQGALIEPPTTLLARKLGFKVLTDLGSLGLEYPHSVIASTRGFLEREPEVSKRFLKAYAEGYALYRSNREAGLRALAKYMKLNDSEMLDETYREFTGKFQNPKPYPTMGGIKLVLDTIATKNPKAAAFKPEDFVFLKYLDEVTGGKP